MPKVKDAAGVRTPAKPRTIDDVGFAYEDRFEQTVIFLRIVFEICILRNHDLRCCMRDTGAQSGAFATICFMSDEHDARIERGEGLKQFLTNGQSGSAEGKLT